MDDPDHLLLDRLEISLGERIRIVEVVVEAALGPGADGDLRLGEQLLHRHGQHMAHGVANPQQLGAFAGFRQGDGGCCPFRGGPSVRGALPLADAGAGKGHHHQWSSILDIDFQDLSRLLP